MNGGETVEAGRAMLTPLFEAWGSPVTLLEVLAFGLSLAMVACNLRRHPAGWPLAMASSLCYAWLFADSRLYGESALQFVFITVSVWGWWQWLKAPQQPGQGLAIRTLPLRGRLLALAATLVAWPAVALLLSRATDSDVPWLDALSTVGSVTGQWLLGGRWIENWPVWLAVNLFSVGLFWFKGLWLTMLLYGLFALLSVVGWRVWARAARAL